MQAARLLHQVSATSAYHTLQEEFYLEQSIDKAIAIDEWAGETVTTSMVDDVFYILRLCGHRALDTGNLPCVCAVLGQLNMFPDCQCGTILEASGRYAWRYESSVLLHQGQHAASQCQSKQGPAAAPHWPHRCAGFILGEPPTS